MSAKARRILALLNDPRRRTRVLDSLNRSTLDDVAPYGADQGMALLKEMNELQSGYEEFLKSFGPRVDMMK